MELISKWTRKNVNKYFRSQKQFTKLNKHFEAVDFHSQQTAAIALFNDLNKQKYKTIQVVTHKRKNHKHTNIYLAAFFPTVAPSTAIWIIDQWHCFCLHEIWSFFGINIAFNSSNFRFTLESNDWMKYCYISTERKCTPLLPTKQTNKSYKI